MILQTAHRWQGDRLGRALNIAPASGFAAAANRVSRRMEPPFRDVFLRAVGAVRGRIDERELLSALFSGDPARVSRTVFGFTGLGEEMLAQGFEQVILRAAIASGEATADVLVDAIAAPIHLDPFRFSERDLNVFLFARRHAAEQVVEISEAAREAVQRVVTVAPEYGLNIDQQATLIREVVGLPPSWAEAPAALAQELRDGRFTESRRLSASGKAQIRKRLKDGPITDEAFIQQMQDRYAESLTNRRAQNIARTESRMATMHGQRESWRQAVVSGHLPANTRRHVVVTPDERLRPDHAQAAAMNPEGIPMLGLYETPWGPLVGPPWEPDPFLCRCGEALSFPGSEELV